MLRLLSHLKKLKNKKSLFFPTTFFKKRSNLKHLLEEDSENRFSSCFLLLFFTEDLRHKLYIFRKRDLITIPATKLAKYSEDLNSEKVKAYEFTNISVCQAPPHVFHNENELPLATVNKQLTNKVWIWQQNFKDLKD